jgi:hypothetical protein
MFSISGLLAFFPVTDEMIFGDLCEFTNSWPSAISPLANVFLAIFEFGPSVSVHFFIGEKLAKVMKFRAVEMAKGSFTVFKEAEEILVFIPEVEAFAMEKVIFKVSVVILIFGKYLKSKTVSPAVLKRTKIEVSLNINSVSVSNRRFESIERLETVVDVQS